MTGDPYELEDIWNNAFADLGRIKVTSLGRSDEEIEAAMIAAAGKADPEKPDGFKGSGAAVPNPYTKSLVRLLLSDTPMPRSARQTLAELLRPGIPPRYNWKLVPERIKNIDPITKQLDSAAAFEENKKVPGMTAEVAAEKAGAKHNVGGKRVRQYQEILQKLGKRLRG